MNVLGHNSNWGGGLDLMRSVFKVFAPLFRGDIEFVNLFKIDRSVAAVLSYKRVCKVLGFRVRKR